MDRLCGTCRHWKAYDEQSPRVAPEGFGTCGKAEMYDHYEHRTAKDNWLFCVVDGSNYFAALKTRDTFGCTEWELK